MAIFTYGFLTGCGVIGMAAAAYIALIRAKHIEALIAAKMAGVNMERERNLKCVAIVGSITPEGEGDGATFIG